MTTADNIRAKKRPVKSSEWDDGYNYGIEAAAALVEAEPPQAVREQRHGDNLFRTAASLGWVDDDGEGPLEFVMRRTREVALEDAADFIASFELTPTTVDASPAPETVSKTNDQLPMALTTWQAWVDDLPLPAEFEAGINGLQEYMRELAEKVLRNNPTIQTPTLDALAMRTAAKQADDAAKPKQWGKR